MQRRVARLVPILAPIGLASLAGLALLAPQAATAADIALVIGNHDYREAPDAVSARADARAVAEALEQRGYDVTSGTDLDRGEMRRRIAEFAEGLDDAERVVVFYSGHAIRSGGVTYLAPVDQTNGSLVEVMMDGVPLELVLQLAGQQPGKSVVFVDGAQLDGFTPRDFAEPGLADIEPPDGVLLISAAAPGRALPRRAVGQSDFGRQVVDRFLVPGVSVGAALRQVGAQAWVAGDTDPSLVLVGQGREPVADSAGTRTSTGSGPAGTGVEDHAAAERRLGLTASERRKVQQKLNRLGHDTRGADGIFGPGTRAALRDWQRTNDLPATGYLSTAQMALLDRQVTPPPAAPTPQAGNGAAARDNAYWSRTIARGTADDYRAYLDSYPDGLHAAEARRALGRMTDGRGDPAAVREREFWRQVQAGDRWADYEAYLERYPNGIWQIEARERLAELAAGEDIPAPPDPAATEAGLGLTRSDRLSMEQRLAYLGFPPGPQDGSFDNGTRRAIEAYQLNRGHNATGYLDRPTVAAVMSETRGADQGVVTGADVLMNILRGLGQQ